MSDSKKTKFKVGDIVTIIPTIPWIKWPELNMVVKQGTKGEVVDVNQRLKSNGGDFDYRVKFPQGIGRLEEDTMIKIGEAEANKAALNKNNWDSVGKKDKIDNVIPDSQKPKFKVGDIVTVKPFQIEWPELNIIIKRGTKGKIFKKWESRHKDIDYYYYIKFPQGKVILLGDSIKRIREEKGGKGVSHKKDRDLGRKDHPDHERKKDKVEPGNRDVEAILKKVEQMGKEFHRIIPFGDKEIIIKDDDEN